MLVITDEDVPESAANYLRSRGHDVQSVRDRFIRGTADPVIAAGISPLKPLFVTWNKRHFIALAKRKSKDGSLRFSGMSVLTFSCHQSEGLARLEQVIDEIEFSHQMRVVVRDERMIVDVGKTFLRIESE